MRLLSLLAAGLLSSVAYMMVDEGAGGTAGHVVTPGELEAIASALNTLDPENDAHWTPEGLPDIDVMEKLTGFEWLSRDTLDDTGWFTGREAARQAKAEGRPLIGPPPDMAPADAPTLPPEELPPAASTEPDPAPPPPPADPDVVAAAEGDPNVPAAAEEAAPPAPDVPATPTPMPQPVMPITRNRIVDLHFPDDTPLDGDTLATGLVVKVNDDGSVNVWAFPANGGEPTFYTGVNWKPAVEAMADGADKNAAMACTWEWPART